MQIVNGEAHAIECSKVTSRGAPAPCIQTRTSFWGSWIPTVHCCGKLVLPRNTRFSASPTLCLKLKADPFAALHIRIREAHSPPSGGRMDDRPPGGQCRPVREPGVGSAASDFLYKWGARRCQLHSNVAA